MGGGEAQCASAVDVDALATWDDNILFTSSAGLSFCGDFFSAWGITYQSTLGVDDSVVGTLSAVGNDIGTVGLALAAEPELAASSSQRQEVDGRAGASGSDTKGAVGIFRSVVARAGEGSSQGNEGQKCRDLHYE